MGQALAAPFAFSERRIDSRLRDESVETDAIRLVDHQIEPSVVSAVVEGDEWPAIRERILAAETVELTAAVSRLVRS